MNRMTIKKLVIIGVLSGSLVASAAAGVAVAATSSPAAAARPVAAVQHVAAVHHVKAASSLSAEPEPSGEATSPETDGPGGHQDAVGQAVDHQFNGTE
jgi:hypothetical protein